VKPKLLVAAAVVSGVLLIAQKTTGIFESNTDIGVTPQKGSVAYDDTKGEYRITGGGANIWAAADAFQFLWKRVSGDISLTTDVHFEGAGAVGHRKAVLMIRQSLEPDAAYADVALHGDGLTSLQFRPTAGAITQEIRSSLTAATRLRIVRHGNEFTMSAGAPGAELQSSGPAMVVLQDPVYVGIGICSHDASVLETAVFSNVRVEPEH